MKIDILKITQLIGLAMSVVQRIKGAKGKEKEAAVIESVQEAVPSIEGILGLDFVNDPALNTVLANYIAARKALWNAVEAAKQLKVEKPA